MSLAMMLVLAWSAGLAWFVRSMPDETLAPSVETEAIIVLTGGQGRVEHGLAMLAAGAAPLLYITGVGEHVTIGEILAKHASAKTREALINGQAEIVLDHVARSTISNAGQSAEFIKEHDIRSIRLVTATYHMTRSIHEFQAVNPGLKIIPDPVFPEKFRRGEWWKHANTRRLIFSEYYKYLAARLRDALRP